MRIRFCGVRGSTPATGTAFASVGGNTSCVAITPSGDPAPSIVLDAGTGIRSISELLGGGPFRGSILLSHLHWDHVLGLPFFRAADRDDAVVRLHVPHDRRHGDRPAEALERFMSPPAFPISPHDLHGDWTFVPLDEGELEVGGLRVLVREIAHKGGRTFGFRLTEGVRTVAYLPDHCLADHRFDDGAAELADRVDVLIHNAQFSDDDASTAEAYGHSTIGQAVEFGGRNRVGRLLLFHHAPEHTDEQLADLVGDLADRDVAVELAREGCEIEV